MLRSDNIVLLILLWIFYTLWWACQTVRVTWCHS